MTKSIMEMTDEILDATLSEGKATTDVEVSTDMPEISDEQRDAMLNESMSEGVIPFDPDARKQHTAQGMSKNTLGRKKPKKTMGTPPGFEKTPEEKAAAAKKPENASLYPRITLKSETRERTQRGNAIRADAARRRQRDGTGSTEASRAQGAADFAKRDAARKAERSASMAAAGEKTRADVAKRRASQTLDPRTGKPRTDGGPTVSTNNDSSKPQNSSITRKQYAVLKEALEILKEATGAGSVGVVTGGKAYSANGPAMGKDNVPIQAVDASMKKMDMKAWSSKKNMTKKSSKKSSKKGAKMNPLGAKKEMENSSFSRFLGTIVNETVKG